METSEQALYARQAGLRTGNFTAEHLSSLERLEARFPLGATPSKRNWN